jgi:Predicted transcriptional regulator
MNFLKNLNCVEELHRLIQQKQTGSPKKLAERLGVNRAKLYVLIEELNALKMPVAYSRKYETFYYTNDPNAISLFKEEDKTAKKGSVPNNGARQDKSIFAH